MKKRASKSTSAPKSTTRRRRQYDEEFKQQAVAMIQNGQSVRPVAEALGVSENLVHKWKRSARSVHIEEAASELTLYEGQELRAIDIHDWISCRFAKLIKTLLHLNARWQEYNDRYAHPFQ